MPALEVTAQSLDLFNHQGGVESLSMDVTEYEQLVDFHKRMDQMQLEQEKRKVKQAGDTTSAEREMRQYIEQSSPADRLSSKY